jgi:hypothetical protein
MTLQVMSFIMTCAGCLLGLRFLFASGAVLKEWGIEATVWLDGRISPDWRVLSRPRPDVLPRTTGCPLGCPLAVCLVAAGGIALLACLGLFEFRVRRGQRWHIPLGRRRDGASGWLHLGMVGRAVTAPWLSGKGRSFPKGAPSSTPSPSRRPR